MFVGAPQYSRELKEGEDVATAPLLHFCNLGDVAAHPADGHPLLMMLLVQTRPFASPAARKRFYCASPDSASELRGPECRSILGSPMLKASCRSCL